MLRGASGRAATESLCVHCRGSWRKPEKQIFIKSWFPEVFRRDRESLQGAGGADSGTKSSAPSGEQAAKRVVLEQQNGNVLFDHGYSLYLLNRQGEAEAVVLPGLPPEHIVALLQELIAE